jgi:signal transduction histidine kinase
MWATPRLVTLGRDRSNRDHEGRAMSERQAWSARPLLLDVPLALLVGLLATVRAFFGIHQAAPNASPTMHPSGPPWEAGPPWEGTGGQLRPTDFGEPYGWSLAVWVLILMVGVAIRRIRPITGFVITVVGTAGYLAVGLGFGPVLIAPALALVAMAARMSVRNWAPWAGLLAPMLWAGFVAEPWLGLTDPGLPSMLLLGGAALLTPALIASLRRNRRQSQVRARELDLRRAAYQERLRIARDVHDVIGHSLSVINMQAGVALYLLDKEADSPVTDSDRTKITESLRAIRSTSKTSLDELRATLSVFRGENGDERAPVAGLERVPELVDAFRKAGRSVELIINGDVAAVPGPIDTAAYRIITEALTNVARHTTDAAATVTVDAGPEMLIIDVSNDGPPVRVDAGSDGSGLVGMVERAEAVGGTVSAGPRPEGGFAVHAEFTTTIGGSTE